MNSIDRCQAGLGASFSLLRTPLRLFAAMAITGAMLLTRTAPLQAEWKAGLAKAELTPRTDVWLAGYGSKRVATETLHPLWIKALALDDGKGHRVVLITSDFQGVPKGMSDRVFEQVKKTHGLRRHRSQPRASSGGPRAQLPGWSREAPHPQGSRPRQAERMRLALQDHPIGEERNGAGSRNDRGQGSRGHRLDQQDQLWRQGFLHQPRAR